MSEVPKRVVCVRLAMSESALDHAELKVPNVALTLGRIRRQRHYPGLRVRRVREDHGTVARRPRLTTTPGATVRIDYSRVCSADNLSECRLDADHMPSAHPVPPTHGCMQREVAPTHRVPTRYRHRSSTP